MHVVQIDTGVNMSATNWEVQADYGYGHGWECVDACDNREAGLDALDLYRENEPGVPLRLKAVNE